jgi:hypothetical protein
MKPFFAIAMSFIFFYCLFSPNIANAGAQQREAPACQEECLSVHRKAVEGLVEKHNVTPDIQVFQRQMDKAVDDYRACIEHCHQVLPVK